MDDQVSIPEFPASVGAVATFSSYLRDNSDLRNGHNPLAGQGETENLRVEESGDGEAAEPEYLSDCSPRDKPWDGHRADADQIAKMYATHPDFQNLGGRVALCSLWLGFAWAPGRCDRRLNCPGSPNHHDERRPVHALQVLARGLSMARPTRPSRGPPVRKAREYSRLCTAARCCRTYIKRLGT